MEPHKSVRVWDLPVRIFHWVLVCCIGVSFYTGLSGGFKEMDYHMLSGYTVFGLVLFRIIWGFAGNRQARFLSFVRPRAVIPYMKTLRERDSAPEKGHNPMGGLSVIALIIVLLVQAVTGLFANDDIFLEGPLVHLVSDDTSDLMTSIHHINLWLLGCLIGLHLVAVTFYEIYKRQRLILAMITGHRQLSQAGEENQASLPAELGKAIIISLVVTGFVYYLLNHV